MDTYLYSSTVTYFGSNYSNDANTGVFWLNVNNSTSNSNSNIDTHLKFSICLKLRLICRGFAIDVNLQPCHLAKYKNIKSVLVGAGSKIRK